MHASSSADTLSQPLGMHAPGAAHTPHLIHSFLQEAAFQSDVEQHDLSGSLDQWRSAVQGAAASAALQVKIAEEQLVAAVGRWVAGLVDGL